MNIDSIDVKILKILQQDAFVPAKKIAEQLNLTTTPIYERIKKLQKWGIIKKYVALLDAELLDKKITVFLNITINNHHADERNDFVREMKKLKSVMEFYHTSGSYDFLVKGMFTDLKSFRDFLVNEISSIQNISDIESQIVLEEIKYTTKIIID